MGAADYLCRLCDLPNLKTAEGLTEIPLRFVSQGHRETPGLALDLCV
jgi:hypothetical protein